MLLRLSRRLQRPAASSLFRAPVVSNGMPRRSLATALGPEFDVKNAADRVPDAHIAGLHQDQDRFWTKIPQWKDVPTSQFLSHKWQMSHSVQKPAALFEFMRSVLPSQVPPQRPIHGKIEFDDIFTSEDFIDRVQQGIKAAPMAFRLSPYILSIINWQDPLNDPVRRQFIPLKSPWNVSHPSLALDPMNEVDNSPVSGFIHRYPTKALFMATSVCPVYCRFCFRSYTVGNETETVQKLKFLPLMKKWQPRFEYIENTPTIEDVVLSGGDTYLLEPEQITFLGERLLEIPHIKRFRFASKGLSVSPSRLIDPNDSWAEAVIQLARKGRKMGKHVCVHTHFNHQQEISWITRLGARRFFEEGVTVRNQTVLLNGVNNSFDRMMGLIRALSDINIEPYYVYQGDMTLGAEDLRTPFHQALELEYLIRDQTAGFLVPRFVSDVPGAGKRPLMSATLNDKEMGLWNFAAPGLKGKLAEYWDPLWCLSDEARSKVMERFADKKQAESVA